MHDLGLFRLGGEDTRLYERELRTEIHELLKKQDELKETKSVLKQKLETGLQTFLAEQITENEKIFYLQGKEIVKELGRLQEGGGNERSSFMVKLLFLSLRSETILKVFPEEIVWKESIGPDFLKKVYKDLEKFSISNYSKHESMINRPQAYYSNLLFTVNAIYGFFYNYIFLYEERLADLERHWQDVQLKELNDSLLKVKENLQRTSETIRDKESRESVLTYRNSKDLYRLDDPGMIEVVALYQYYDEVANKIYGSQGKSFLKFLKKKVKFSIRDFEKKYEKFMKEESFHDPSVGILALDRTCNHANFLVKRWNESNVWAQYAFDFTMTNLDIPHDVGKRDNRNLHTDSHSALYAKVLIDKFREQAPESYDEGDFKEEFPFKIAGGSLGELMIRVYDLLKKGEQLEIFIQGRCQEIVHLGEISPDGMRDLQAGELKAER